MPSKHQRIITAIVERLETVLTANGYETDIGARVRDSEPNWQQDELPAISIFEMPTDAVDSADNLRLTVWQMPVLIKVFLVKGTDASLARSAIADIYKAIKSTGTPQDRYRPERWPDDDGPAAMLTSPRRHGIEYDADTFEVAGANVEIEVQYKTEKFNLEE